MSGKVDAEALEDALAGSVGALLLSLGAVFGTRRWKAARDAFVPPDAAEEQEGEVAFEDVVDALRVSRSNRRSEEAAE